MCAQLGHPPAELLKPRATGPLGHRAGLEGAEVPVERPVDAMQLALYPLDLGLALRALRVELGERFLDRLSNERLLLQHRREALQDGVVEFLRRKAVGVACLLPIAVDQDSPSLSWPGSTSLLVWEGGPHG